MNKKIEQIVKKCLENKVHVELELKEGQINYILKGFYKSSGVTLEQQGENIAVKQRYNEVDYIEDFDELVRINYRWWQYSKDRYEGWVSPESAWLQPMLDMGLIKAETKTVTTYQ